MYGAAAAVVVGGAILIRWAYARRCAADDEPRPGNSWARGSRVITDHRSAAKGRTFIVTGATSGLGCEAARLGTPESSMPSDAFAVARTSHWRHTAFGIPKQTNIAASKVPGVGIPPQPSRSSQVC
jgi:hypothetical protein